MLSFRCGSWNHSNAEHQIVYKLPRNRIRARQAKWVSKYQSANETAALNIVDTVVIAMHGDLTSVDYSWWKTTVFTVGLCAVLLVYDPGSTRLAAIPYLRGTVLVGDHLNSHSWKEYECDTWELDIEMSMLLTHGEMSMLLRHGEYVLIILSVLTVHFDRVTATQRGDSGECGRFYALSLPSLLSLFLEKQCRAYGV